MSTAMEESCIKATGHPTTTGYTVTIRKGRRETGIVLVGYAVAALLRKYDRVLVSVKFSEKEGILAKNVGGGTETEGIFERISEISSVMGACAGWLHTREIGKGGIPVTISAL